MERESDPLLVYANDEICEQLLEFHVKHNGYRCIIRGYKFSLKKSILTWLMIVLTFGLLYLLFHWRPRWKLIATHTHCSLAAATKILVLETFQTKCKTFHIKNVITMRIEDRSENIPFSYQNENFNDNESNEGSSSNSFKLYFEDGSYKNVSSYRFFRCKKLSYVWDDERNCFLRMIGIEKSMTCVQLHSIQGYSKAQQARMHLAYGKNEIDVPVQSIFTLFLLEFFNPFYIFQLFTIAVWLAENYYYYCVAIVIMSIFGISTTIIQTKRNQINLKRTVHSVGDVKVCRDRTSNIYEDICSSHLVPGDIILIPPSGCTMHVDAVLLDGSCIVNESMLTGESVPITKTALPHYNRFYDMKTDSHHTLYCGTKVIQTRYYKDESVRAVVLRTGFLTAKGELVRSIMYPLPADFKFDRDSYKFIWILTLISIIGLIYTIILKSGRQITASDVIIKSLDILTIVIPPALPAAMTVGRLYAISRLKSAGVFCINPRVINVSGSTSCVCFDKTGTLTEDGLDMWGVIPVRFLSVSNVFDGTSKILKSSKSGNDIRIEEKSFGNTNFLGKMYLCEDNLKTFNDADELGSGENIVFDEPIRNPQLLSDFDLFKIGMNVCHSLTILDNKLSGDPLDIKMFESTGWILDEPTVPDNTKFDLLVPTVVKSHKNNESDFSQEWGIIQQYQFSSSLQRSSVICKELCSEKYTAFCKGSPEMISALSKPHTVPQHLKNVLRHYTQQGYRVLAMACRQLSEESYLKIQKLTREQVETDLIFLGLIVLENRLKPETSPVIEELQKANIKVVMITGDNLDTAVSVAVECGIVKREEKLILCEATVPDDTNSLPQIYYSSSMINIEGLRHSVAINVPPLVQTLTNEISSSNFATTSSDVTLCQPSTSSSSLSTDVENGIGFSKYKFAMTGATWKILKDYFPELIPKLITRGAVFARMSSDQKQQLVQELQSLGYYVAMCGDGANDCGALKTAHVGISVSGEESSVASPFTSTAGHVGCVPLVIREGRAALTTSFGMFKFIVAYSITEFLSVALLYYFDSNLTDFQFLYIDVFIIVPFAFFFGKTHAYPGRLFKKPPETSLLGFISLFSLTAQLMLITWFQTATFLILKLFPWYKQHTYQGDIAYLSYENYGVFCVSMFQYIILVILFSYGKPYRKGIWTNSFIMMCIIVHMFIGIYITIYPANWIISLLELKMPPDYTYGIIILALAFANLVIGVFIEKVIIQYMMQQKGILPARLRNDFPTNNSYQLVEKQLEKECNWPPLSKNACEKVGN